MDLKVQRCVFGQNKNYCVVFHVCFESEWSQWFFQALQQLHPVQDHRKGWAGMQRGEAARFPSPHRDKQLTPTDSSEWPINQKCMFLDCGKKLDCPEKTPTWMGWTWKLKLWPSFKPWPFWCEMTGLTTTPLCSWWCHKDVCHHDYASLKRLRKNPKHHSPTIWQIYTTVHPVLWRWKVLRSVYCINKILTSGVWHIQLPIPAAGRRWFCEMCLLPSESTGPSLPVGCDILSQQAWRGPWRWFTVHQQNSRVIVNKHKSLLQWVSLWQKMRAFQRTILPSEPPEEDLWQERSIFHGTRILQQIKDLVQVFSQQIIHCLNASWASQRHWMVSERWYEEQVRKYYCV